MKPIVLILLALPLAACEPSRPPAKAPVAVNPGPPGPLQSQPPSYVGRWAASPDLCAAGAWVFTDKSLVTAGEVSCTFAQVTANDTGWIAEGACTAQGPAQPATLVLNTTRAGPGRSLAVSGGPFPGSQILALCPVDPASLAAPLADAEAIDKRIAIGGAELKPYEFKQASLISQAWRIEGGAPNPDGLIKIAEPLLGDLGRKLAERLYYFRPGAAHPFLIRESEASYAVDSGHIVAVYSRDGVELQMSADRDKAELERRLIGRAVELKKAAEG